MEEKEEGQVCAEAMGSSEEHQQEQREDPTTTVIKSKAGHAIMVKHITTGNKSAKGEKQMMNQGKGWRQIL